MISSQIIFDLTKRFFVTNIFSESVDIIMGRIVEWFSADFTVLNQLLFQKKVGFFSLVSSNFVRKRAQL